MIYLGADVASDAIGRVEDIALGRLDGLPRGNLHDGGGSGATRQCRCSPIGHCREVGR